MTQEWWELKPSLRWGADSEGSMRHGREKSRPPPGTSAAAGGTRGTLLLVGGEGGSPRHLCGLSFPNWVQPTYSLITVQLLLRSERSRAISPPGFQQLSSSLMCYERPWILVLTLPSQAFWRPNLAWILSSWFPFFRKRDRLHEPWNSRTPHKCPELIIVIVLPSTPQWKWGRICNGNTLSNPSLPWGLPRTYICLYKGYWDGVKSHLTLGLLTCKLR